MESTRIPSSFISVILILLISTFTCEKVQAQQKISQFERAGFCDFLIDKSGVYHAVFQESPDFGKPTFIYYSTSNNKGESWSKPITLSNDNSGNGAGYPRILQDGRGQIYAFWKRYGKTAAQYPVKEVTLDGPGGYTLGTLYYKVLSAGTWSNAIQLNEVEGAQNSWFASVSPQGNVHVFWTQVSEESLKNNWLSWYYCDFLRTVTLNGTVQSEFADMNTPSKPAYARGAPPKEGAINLDGYVDKDNIPHFIYEDIDDNVQQLKYFDGKSTRVVYKYPKFTTGNSFNNPAKLMVDEKGQDHIVFKPHASTLESEQIWDINLATNKTVVLASIQKKGVQILGFQATQGPKGKIAITFEAGSVGANTEAFGLYYENGKWTSVGLTKNASKEDFFTTTFIGLGGYRTSISTLTRYNSTFGSVAYDASGKKSMLMTISAYWTTGAYSTSSPSLVYLPIDK
jgi:hypothetical protein